MMEFAKALAANTDLASAQAFIFPQGDNGTGAIITGDGENVFIEIKRQVLDIESQFYQNDQTVSEFINTLFDNLKDQLKNVADLQFLVFVWHQDVLYIQSTGGVQAYLKRNREFITLTETAPNGQMLSGHIQPGDRVIICTQSLIDFFDYLEARKSSLDLLIESSIEEFEATLQSIVRDHQYLKPVAIVTLQAPIPVQEEVYNASPEIMKRPSFSRPRINLLPLLRRIDRLHLNKFQVIGVSVLIVLLVLLGVVLKLNHGKLPTQNNSSLVTSIKSDLASASQLKDSDPAAARQKLSSAGQSLARLSNSDPKNDQLPELKTALSQAEADVSHSYTVTDWPTFLTLSLIKNGFSSEKMSLSVGQLLVLDKNQNSLVLIDMAQKSNTILAGQKQMGTARFSSVNGDYSYSYSVDRGVVQIDNQNQDASNIIKADDSWGRIQDIVGFGGNVYLLDDAKNQIWKYLPIATGFSEKQPYFKSDVTLASARMMLIDSSVWILNEDNTIDRYTAGVADFFSIGGLDTPIKDITSFFVSDKTDYIYILDPVNSRMVVLAKDGKYYSEYKGDKFKTAQDLVVDEKAKKAYILSQGTIYSVDLR